MITMEPNNDELIATIFCLQVNTIPALNPPLHNLQPLMNMRRPWKRNNTFIVYEEPAGI